MNWLELWAKMQVISMLVGAILVLLIMIVLIIAIFRGDV